jgi:hypothetical protein
MSRRPPGSRGDPERGSVQIGEAAMVRPGEMRSPASEGQAASWSAWRIPPLHDPPSKGPAEGNRRTAPGRSPAYEGFFSISMYHRLYDLCTVSWTLWHKVRPQGTPRRGICLSLPSAE